jgi:hypothetical protein
MVIFSKREAWAKKFGVDWCTSTVIWEQNV